MHRLRCRALQQDAAMYEEDLSQVHIAGFTGHHEALARGVLRTLRASGIGHGLVIDLGCGGGEWVAGLLSAGFDAIGVDQSPAMIRRARSRVPAARFECASWSHFSIPRCDAITALGEVFNYIGPAPAGLFPLARFFRRAHRALRPGGALLFDLAIQGRASGGAPARTFFEGDGWVLLLNKVEDRKRRVLTRTITTFRKAGTMYRRSDEVHRLQLLRPAAVTARLREAGFEVTASGAFGGYTLDAGLRAFVARRR
jgi:SAM-dependent methyltransferase